MARIIPRDFFYAAIIFTMLSAVVVGLLTMVQAGDSAGGGTVNLFEDSSRDEIEYFNRSFNIQDDMINKTNYLKTQIRSLKPETTLEAVTLPVAFIKTAWGIIDFIITSFGFMDGAIKGTSGFLNIPTWLPVLIIALIVILFVFSIISLIFGKDI